jgi:hypothetical protein
MLPLFLAKTPGGKGARTRLHRTLEDERHGERNTPEQRTLPLREEILCRAGGVTGRSATESLIKVTNPRFFFLDPGREPERMRHYGFVAIVPVWRGAAGRLRATWAVPERRA